MLPPGSGLGIYTHSTPKVIRLLRQGCTNRPFYHIVVALVSINNLVMKSGAFITLFSYSP